MPRFTPSFALVAVFFSSGLLFGAPFAFAYVASSSSYRIQEDSINTGGILSTSTSYRIEDTIGESGTGTSSSATYQIKAGYQQMQEIYLAISVPGNVTLSPSILTTGGGTSTGAATWTVITDNLAGYTMNIRASSSPALQSGVNSFANYIPAGAAPDFTFTTPSATSYFGFSPESTDLPQRYKDNGTTCNTGALDTASACWDPVSTTATTIASRTTANNPSGTATTIRFRAESGVSNTQPVGTYTATSTLTLIAN